MSDREQVMKIIDRLPETTVRQILIFLRGVQFADELEDDALGERLYQQYLDDPDKDESYTLEECKKEWGLHKH